MRSTALKMWAVFLLSIFISGFTSKEAKAEAKRDNSPTGRIVYVDQVKGFAVLNLGKKDGLTNGLSFAVERQGTKVGEVQLLKVRQKFSAADIKRTYHGQLIQVGDTVKLTHKRHLAKTHITCNYNEKLTEQSRDRIEELFAQAQERLKNEQYKLAEENIQEILQLEPKNKKARELLEEAREQGLQVLLEVEPEIITLDINAPKRVIHSTAIDVLEKFGCLVTFADQNKYNLEASKFIDLPPAMEITSDWGPHTRSKIYYTVEIVEIKEAAKSKPAFANRLIVYFRGAYDKNGQVYYHQIKEGTSAYKETQKMASTIKCLAEEL